MNLSLSKMFKGIKVDSFCVFTTHNIGFLISKAIGLGKLDITANNVGPEKEINNTSTERGISSSTSVCY